MKIENIENLEDGSALLQVTDISEEDRRVCFDLGVSTLRASKHREVLVAYQRGRITERVVGIGLLELIKQQTAKED